VYAYDPTNNNINYFPTSDSLICTNTQDFNQGAIVNALNTVPEQLKALFQKEGVRIYYTAGISMSERGYYGCAVSPTVSYYSDSKKIVSVVKKPSIFIYHDADIASTVPHECGHTLDHIAGYITGTYKGEYGISQSTEWNTLYNNNFNSLASIDAMINYHMQKGTIEAFADAFRIYCTKPDKLKNSCPDVYNYIASQIAKYAGGSVPAKADVTKENFNARDYADRYPDLKAAFGYDKNALWDHYIKYGKAEGRTITSVNP